MFWSQMPYLFIKICCTIKINSICGAGQDTWNLRHKINSQGSALRIVGLRVTISNSQGPISRVLGVRVPCPRVSVRGSWVSGSRVPGSQSPRVRTPKVPGLRVRGSRVSGSWGPGSQVLILDYALVIMYFIQIFFRSVDIIAFRNICYVMAARAIKYMCALCE